jgi:hypothetical protein
MQIPYTRYEIRVYNQKLQKTMTDTYKYQRTTKNEIIDLTSDSDGITTNTGSNMRSVDIHFNNNPMDEDDEDEFDDGVSTMHQLGSVTCTVRANKIV